MYFSAVHSRRKLCVWHKTHFVFSFFSNFIRFITYTLIVIVHFCNCVIYLYKSRPVPSTVFCVCIILIVGLTKNTPLPLRVDVYLCCTINVASDFCPIPLPPPTHRHTLTHTHWNPLARHFYSLCRGLVSLRCLTILNWPGIVRYFKFNLIRHRRINLISMYD